MYKQFSLHGLLSLFFVTQCAFATSFQHPWHVSAEGGVFNGKFDMTYQDQTDVIPQNIQESVFQHGYSLGLRIGYDKLFRNGYLLGAELSGDYHSNKAIFASGAATTAFSDQMYLNGSLDLAMVGGMLITENTAWYGKLGMSYGFIGDRLTSPAGYTPMMVQTNSTRQNWGGVIGVGVKGFVADQLAVYTEYNYHDYGSVDFPNFTNFTATYSHSAHVYTQEVLFGLSYYW